jgi:hypothetical protein
MTRTIVAISLLVVGDCTPDVIDTACSAFRPITYCGDGCSGPQDSQATKDQIKEHNVYRQLCR